MPRILSLPAWTFALFSWLWPSRRRTDAVIEQLQNQVKAQHDALQALGKKASEHEAFFRNVIDTVPGFVCVKELGGKFVLGNRCLADAYGTTTEAIVGRSDYDFNNDTEEVASFVEADRKVIEERTPTRIACEKFTDSNGRARWLQTIKIPLVEKDGSCRRLLAVALDVTESRRLQDELQQAQKLQAVGQLASGLAHDFNNSLTVIIGNVEALDESLPSNSASRELCEAIGDAATHAASLVQDLMMFARKAPVTLSRTDLKQLLANTVRLLRPSVRTSIHIVANLPPRGLVTKADAKLLQSALVNLAMNGAYAMPQGGTLTFSLDPDLQELQDDESWGLKRGRYVTITVQDTGSGMTDDVQNRMFEPFFTTKEPGQGTGLGLSAVYGTIRSHNGKIEVASTVGSGSTFKLFLPIA